MSDIKHLNEHNKSRITHHGDAVAGKSLLNIPHSPVYDLLSCSYWSKAPNSRSYGVCCRSNHVHPHLSWYMHGQKCNPSVLSQRVGFPLGHHGPLKSLWPADPASTITKSSIVLVIKIQLSTARPLTLLFCPHVSSNKQLLILCGHRNKRARKASISVKELLALYHAPSQTWSA